MLKSINLEELTRVGAGPGAAAGPTGMATAHPTMARAIDRTKTLLGYSNGAFRVIGHGDCTLVDRLSHQKSKPQVGQVNKLTMHQNGAVAS